MSRPSLSPKPAFSSYWRALAVSTLVALSANAASNDLLKMTEQLDRLDRAEMLEFLGKAEDCLQAGDFPCAEGQLLKARKFAKSGVNQRDWQRVNELLVSEKGRVEEQRLARQRAAEEAERQQRRIAREAEEERERERRQAARLAAMERESEPAAPSTAYQVLGALNATLQNYNSFNAKINAQQQATFRQAAETRARDAEAERSRQRAAAQRLADERSQLEAQRAARDRREEEKAAAERTRSERALAEANAEANAERERVQRVQAEREERQRALAAEQAAQRERDQRAAELRQRQERDKAERLARQEADKAAEAQQLAEFHAALTRGIRLVAVNCYGQWSATGTRPKLKEPRAGGCIDVAYEASCPDNRQAVRGVAKNFVGMSGCFGDTYEFPSKPACDIKDVRVRVVSVASCS